MPEDEQRMFADSILGDSHLVDIKTQIEFYFSDYNYPTDYHMNTTLANKDDGYIYIDDILAFSRMKYLRAAQHHIVEITPFTDVFELDSLKIKIRKKAKSLNNDLKVLGFDKEGIRNFTLE